MTPRVLPMYSELTLLLRYLEAPRNGGVLVDVGAHTGSVSQAFARKGWRAVCFEPAKDNFEDLERVMSKFPDTLLIPKAVSDETKEGITFYRSTEHWGIHSLVAYHETHTEETVVDTVRLDDALSASEVNAVDVLKIDVEGADFLALRSLDFEHFRPRLVMTEFADDRTALLGYDHHDVVRYMAGKGYAAWISEWAPIVAYGRRGGNNSPHTFLRCCPYPVRHQPAWGNLIFVPDDDAPTFDAAVAAYLADLVADSRAAMKEMEKAINRKQARARQLLASVEDQAVRLAARGEKTRVQRPKKAVAKGAPRKHAAAKPPAAKKQAPTKPPGSGAPNAAWKKMQQRVTRLENRVARIERRLQRRRSIWRRAARKLLPR